jgi:4-carboxymuconolactone decarboxylase
MDPDRSVRLRAKVPTAPERSASVQRMDERYERGRQRFLEVHDEKALRAVEGLGELGEQIVSYVYGDLYMRPALTDRDRELGAVVALTALGRSSQLPQHLRAALKAGLSEAELREAIMLTASIAGFPPAMNATSTLKSVLAERSRQAEEPTA